MEGISMDTEYMEQSTDLPVQNNQMGEVKPKRRLISNACTFCKERHLKCDGNQPCSQCIQRARNDKCEYKTAVKRGRKPNSKNSLVGKDKSPDKIESLENELKFWREKYFQAKEQIQPSTPENLETFSPLLANIQELDQSAFSVSPFNNQEMFLMDVISNENSSAIMESIDSSIPICFSSFEKHVQPIFDFHLSVDINFDWQPWKKISLDSATSIPNYSLHGLVDAFEFSTVCALGARMVSPPKGKSLSREFIQKAEKFSHLLFYSERAQCKYTGADRLVKILCLLVYYYAGSGNFEKAQMTAGLAYNVFCFNRALIPDTTLFRLYAFLAATSRSFKDKLHWIKMCESIENGKIVSNRMCECIFMLSTLFHDDTSHEELNQILWMVLRALEEIEAQISPLEDWKKKDSMLVLYACRANIFARMDLKSQAKYWALQSLSEQYRNPSCHHLGIPFSHFFSLQILRDEPNQTKLIEEVLDIVKTYATFYETVETKLQMFLNREINFSENFGSVREYENNCPSNLRIVPM